MTQLHQSGDAPTPFYDDGQIAIYNGDCREILPLLGARADLILTDPPYGINVVQAGQVGGHNAGRAKAYRPVVGDETAPDLRFLFAFAPKLIVWGGNYFGASLAGSESRWLVWDKREGGSSDNFADCELAWTNLGGPSRIHRQLWRGMLTRSDGSDGDRVHPTQKPLQLMRWCLSLAPDASLILDPYMGSGSTLRAAKDLGRRAIGIEVDRHYCEAAVGRLGQGVLNMEAA